MQGDLRFALLDVKMTTVIQCFYHTVIQYGKKTLQF